MALGILPALIGAAAALAPTIYGIVDDQQRRKLERKEKNKEQLEAARLQHYQNAGVPAVQVPGQEDVTSKWPDWALPVAITGGIILFGTTVVLALSGGKKKSKKSRREVDNEDEDE